MESSILNAADRVIVTTPLARRNYINGFNLTANKIISITNGYDEEDFIGICADIKCKDRFTILHNGLLYSIRTPITFFKALSEAIKDGLINRDKISIDFTWTENDQLWIDYAKLILRIV